MMPQTKPRVLVIPHFPLGPVRTRTEMLARYLSQFLDVYYLNWPYGFGGPRQRVSAAVSGLFRMIRMEPREWCRTIEVPYFRLGKWRSLGMRVNNLILSNLVQPILHREGISAVVSASLIAYDATVLGVPFIYDMVDLHPAYWPDAQQADRQHLVRQLTNASVVYAASLSGAQRLAEELKRLGLSTGKLKVVPNGAPVATLRQATGQSVRRQMKLEGRFVIGYVGNHGRWSGLEFLVEVYCRIRALMGDTTLLIVGPIEHEAEVRRLVSQRGCNGIIMTGAVPPDEVAEYIAAIDVGVLPSPPTAWNNTRFPIKVLEYTAARKLVLTSPLAEVQRLGFPNVEVQPLDVVKWTDALVRLRSVKWDNSWDRMVDPYDWAAIGQRVLTDIEILLKEV